MNINMKLIKATALSLFSSKSFKDIDDKEFIKLKHLSLGIDLNLLDVNVLNAENTINHYDRITRCIIFDLNKDINNKKGAYSTFYHELGHHIDWELSLPSDNEEFRKSLIFEGNLFLKNIDTGHLERYFIREARASGLSDILSGITLNNYKFRYKHSNKYWLSSRTKICFEAFAHFYEALIRHDDYKVRLYKNIFPTSFNMFLNMIYNKNSAKQEIA